jgi:hypothetical protein
MVFVLLVSVLHATLKIVDTFQEQIKKNGSDARIKMFGDIPLAAGWWSWLLR